MRRMQALLCRTLGVRGVGVALALVLAVGLADRATALDISLLPSSSPGPSATLELVVSGLADGAAPSLGVFDIDIVFDDAAADVTAVSFGAELGGPTNSFAEWIDGAGVSSLAEVSLLSPAALDTAQPDAFVLATLEVDLLGPGPVTFSFGDVLLGDALGARLIPDATNGATVGGAVPEPSAAAVFALGVAFVAARLRRRGRSATDGLLGLGAVFALVAAAPQAHAGFPSNENPDADQQAVLRYVCAEDTATQCLDLDADGISTGIECPSPPADPVCVPDFLPGAIRGTLTVLSDDVSAEGNGNRVRMTVVFDFKVKDQSYVLADTFDDIIGGWNFVFDENEILNFEFVGGTLFQGNLTPLRNRVLDLAVQELGVPSNARPVVAEGLIATSSTPSGANVRKAPGRDASAPTDGTATVARYRITVRFVPPR